MKQDIRNRETRERQKYVPSSVKVIEFTAGRAVCTSSSSGWRETDTDSEETLF